MESRDDRQKIGEILYSRLILQSTRLMTSDSVENTNVISKAVGRTGTRASGLVIMLAQVNELWQVVVKSTGIIKKIKIFWVLWLKIKGITLIHWFTSYYFFSFLSNKEVEACDQGSTVRAYSKQVGEKNPTWFGYPGKRLFFTRRPIGSFW